MQELPCPTPRSSQIMRRVPPWVSAVLLQVVSACLLVANAHAQATTPADLEKALPWGPDVALSGWDVTRSTGRADLASGTGALDRILTLWMQSSGGLCNNSDEGKRLKSDFVKCFAGAVSSEYSSHAHRTVNAQRAENVAQNMVLWELASVEQAQKLLKTFDALYKLAQKGIDEHSVSLQKSLQATLQSYAERAGKPPGGGGVLEYARTEMPVPSKRTLITAKSNFGDESIAVFLTTEYAHIYTESDRKVFLGGGVSGNSAGQDPRIVTLIRRGQRVLIAEAYSNGHWPRSVETVNKRDEHGRLVLLESKVVAGPVFPRADITAMLRLGATKMAVEHPAGVKTPATVKPEVSWKIIKIEGDEAEVDANGTGDLDIAEEGVGLGRNGRIITGMNTTVTIRHARFGIVTIRELSNFCILRYTISQEGKTPDTTLKVGEVNIKVDRNYKEIDFSVSTPTCIVGVRGTEFNVSHQATPSMTTIAVLSGTVEVTPTLFSAPAVTVSAGQRITVYENRFGAPSSLDRDEPGGFDLAVARLCSQDDDFVRSLYHCITHREPTAQEIREQVGLLRNGTPRQHMIAYFFASPGYENQKYGSIRFITDTCQAIYGRQPTDADLRAWPRAHRKTIVLDMFKHADHLTATRACPALWPTIPDWSTALDGPAPQSSAQAPADVPGWLTQAPAKVDSISPKADQWSTSGGGFLVMSGSHTFDKRWFRSSGGEKNPGVLNDEVPNLPSKFGECRFSARDLFRVNDEDTQSPPRHSYAEVMSHAKIKQGTVTVRGPGALAYFLRRKQSGPGVRLFDTATGQPYWPQHGGEQTIYEARNWVFKDGRWQGEWIGDFRGNVNDLHGDRPMSGWVPAGQTRTLEVFVEQGCYHNVFPAPSEIEYELWFFPREGGGVKIDPAP